MWPIKPKRNRLLTKDYIPMPLLDLEKDTPELEEEEEDDEEKRPCCLTSREIKEIKETMAKFMAFYLLLILVLYIVSLF